MFSYPDERTTRRGFSARSPTVVDCVTIFCASRKLRTERCNTAVTQDSARGSDSVGGSDEIPFLKIFTDAFTLSLDNELAPSYCMVSLPNPRSKGCRDLAQHP